MSIIPPPNPRATATNDGRDGRLQPTPPQGPAVQMKVRADLTFDRMNYQGVEYWVVKEPLGQKYYQFPPHVFHLLRELDGNQLQDDYHEKFAPKRITRQDLQQLLTRFHQDGLVTSNTPGQGIELLKRGEKSQLMERVGAFANILAIRYKGFDPERILNFMLPYTWWIFTKAAAIATLILSVIALLSVLMNWASFQSMLPGFEAFFDPRQWYLFALVLCGTKVVHEFGHGLSCKRLGGECHEIGFMLLVLTPLSLLQRVRQLAAQQQVASRCDWRRRNVCRSHPRDDRHICLVVCSTRICARHRTAYHAGELDQYGPVQR